METAQTTMTDLETVGEVKETGEFTKVEKFDPQFRDLRDRYGEYTVFFVSEGDSPMHTIAYGATCNAEGAPAKRLQ